MRAKSSIFGPFAKTHSITLKLINNIKNIMNRMKRTKKKVAYIFGVEGLYQNLPNMAIEYENGSCGPFFIIMRPSYGFLSSIVF